MINPTPMLLPNGNQLWFGDAVPSGDSVVQTQFQLGDFLWIDSTTAGLPLMYKLTTVPSSTNKDGLWQALENGTTFKAVSAAYTALATDSTIIQTNGVGVAITLPAASAANAGKTYTVKNLGGATTNTVVVAGGGAIDGGTTVTLTNANTSVVLRSNGTQYYVVSAYSTLTVT